MTIRPLLVEAVIRTIDDWPTVDTPEYKGLDGGAVLDAVLSVLSDHADEWAESTRRRTNERPRCSV